MHTRSVSDLLVGDHARSGRIDIDDCRGVLRIGSKHFQMIQGGLYGDRGLSPGILCDLQILFGDRSPIVEDLGSLELRFRQRFIGNSLPVVGKGLRDILALHLQQELPFRNRVPEPRVNLDNPARCQRDRRDVS